MESWQDLLLKRSIASREAMLRLRRSSCQDSIRQILEIDHQVVARRVIARHGGAPGVAAALVERARRGVRLEGGRLDDDQADTCRRQLLLDRPQRLATDSRAAPRR